MKLMHGANMYESGKNPVSKHQIQHEAGSAVPSRPALSFLRRERGQGNIIFPVQLTTCRISNRIRLIHATCITLLKVLTIHRGRSFSSHQKVVFRCQKRQIFHVKNSTCFTFYVGHSTRQAIVILQGASAVNSARRTATHITTTSFSTTTDSVITTAVRYFEYCFPKQIAAPWWTPASAAPLFHKPRSSDT